MVRVLGLVEGREIINHGLFVFRVGSEVIIIPFDDDDEYRIFFSIIDSGGDGSSTSRTESETKSIRMIHYRSWLDGKPSAFMGSKSFASDSDYDYFISFSVMPIGIKSKFAYQVGYTISRGKLS